MTSFEKACFFGFPGVHYDLVLASSSLITSLLQVWRTAILTYQKLCHCTRGTCSFVWKVVLKDCWEEGEVNIHFSMGLNVCLVLCVKAAGRRGKMPGAVPTAL